MNRSRAGAVLLLVLAGPGNALVGCGQTSSVADVESCDDPVCCAPVDFDPERSRAYLLGGQLALYLATTGEVYAPGQPFYAWSNTGQVEAEVSSALTKTALCDARTQSARNGLNGQHCAVSTTQGLSCGQEVTFDLGFRSTHRDPDTDQSICSAAPFTTRVTWTAAVTCAECPSSFGPREACDQPPSLSCSHRVVNDPFCGTISSLPCNCSSVSETGERLWSCAVC
jgi:hypothetical protein